MISDEGRSCRRREGRSSRRLVREAADSGSILGVRVQARRVSTLGAQPHRLSILGEGVQAREKYIGSSGLRDGRGQRQHGDKRRVRRVRGGEAVQGRRPVVAGGSWGSWRRR